MQTPEIAMKIIIPKIMTYARSICIYVGSGDPVRVLRLLHTTNTLDTLEAFIAETYVQLATTELCATLLADLLSLKSADRLLQLLMCK